MEKPAFLIAGTHSGCGKTTLTLGIMAALARRGLTVAPFKCGPDFIDPSLHRLATGNLSRNLDLWMAGPDFVRAVFHRHTARADVAVVEGVMGLYDGGEGSGAALARFLGLPVVLVIDARSMTESVAALVQGFAEFDPALRFAGVICNRTGSDRHRDLLAKAIGQHCRVPLLGCLGRDEAVTIPSRHLGLHMAADEPLAAAGLDRLADLVEEAVDLDRLLAGCRVEIDAPAGASCPRVRGGMKRESVLDRHGPAALAMTTEGAPSLVIARSRATKQSGICPQPRIQPEKGRKRIAVARDSAFCFCYQDNLEMLAAAGAELVFFSPMADAELPEGIGGIYLCGGYPELHADRLAANVSMREAVRRWSAAGGLLYAECGGFMYLTEGIESDGRFTPMAGIFPVRARMRRGRVALGYREAELRGACCFGPPGSRLRGHEFHYSDVDPMPPAVERLYRLKDGSDEGYRIDNTLGSYLHLHFGSRPEAAACFVAAAAKVGDKKEET
ncbi:MAG: cobyrinate a,c-diamide synthase [Thermodesulfobacteriota bacterium]